MDGGRGREKKRPLGGLSWYNCLAHKLEHQRSAVGSYGERAEQTTQRRPLCTHGWWLMRAYTYTHCKQTQTNKA